MPDSKIMERDMQRETNQKKARVEILILNHHLRLKI